MITGFRVEFGSKESIASLNLPPGLQSKFLLTLTLWTVIPIWCSLHHDHLKEYTVRENPDMGNVETFHHESVYDFHAPPKHGL